MALIIGFTFYEMFVSWIVYGQKLIFQRGTKRQDRIYLFIAFTPLILLECLRRIDVGNDTYSYYSLFNYYNGLSGNFGISTARRMWLEGIEPGYILLNKVVGYFTHNYQVFISIIAIFSFFVVVRFIYKYSTNMALSSILFFLMFYGTYTNMLRQIIAMSFVLLAFDSLVNKNYFGFIVKVIIAMMFHRTAFIAFALIFFWKRKPSKFAIAIILIIMVGIGVLGRVSYVLGFLGITTTYTDIQAGASVNWNAIKNILLLIAVLFVKRDGWNFDENITSGEMIDGFKNLIDWTPVLCLAIAFIALGMPAAIRFDNYYSLFYIIEIPFLMSFASDLDTNKVIVTGAILILLITYTLGIHFFRLEWSTELNYHLYWQNQSAQISGIDRTFR